MTSHAYNAVVAVVHQFFDGLDRRHHQASAALIARHGVWNRQGTELAGPDAVLAALEQRDPKRQTAHLITNLWLEAVTDTTARVHFYLSAYETVADANGVAGAPQFLGVRAGIDELVMEDGQWRIQSKTSRRLLPAE